MNKKIVAAIGAVLVLGLAGCGNAEKKDTSNKTSMNNMKMDHNKMGESHTALTKAFQDELNGFTKIEQDVKNKNFGDATTIADNLHNEFHAAILPPLKDKKGTAYAEEIHGKYDELQDAIKSKNPTKIAELIKVNRDNLHTVANILGVSIK
ncbi:hypothetical protein J5Y03_08925 [Bacillus sp. RG28]|uniref:Lipoprotein n=1 Tax=Gottfriedia endophytica TaxID=2820819 RepID=A0A940SGP8_9BACI|nr:hypothetical protein [Gottfriedia endophytica]MBP0725312.1 hypothetical protein [Gottfriedia endophytica]